MKNLQQGQGFLYPSKCVSSDSEQIGAVETEGPGCHTKGSICIWGNARTLVASCHPQLLLGLPGSSCPGEAGLNQ